MAEFRARLRKESYAEFALINPTNLAEFMKAVNAARQQLSGVDIHDDTIQIRADDEEIVVFFKEYTR